MIKKEGLIERKRLTTETEKYNADKERKMERQKR